jgi:hypothetical protein
MTMFAATFPWAAPAAFLYNLLELRVDARKLLYYCKTADCKTLYLELFTLKFT